MHLAKILGEIALGSLTRQHWRVVCVRIDKKLQDEIVRSEVVAIGHGSKMVPTLLFKLAQAGSKIHCGLFFFSTDAVHVWREYLLKTLLLYYTTCKQRLGHGSKMGPILLSKLAQGGSKIYSGRFFQQVQCMAWLKNGSNPAVQACHHNGPCEMFLNKIQLCSIFPVRAVTTALP